MPGLGTVDLDSIISSINDLDSSNPCSKSNRTSRNALSQDGPGVQPRFRDSLRRHAKWG